jgi:hypothetical protein
MVIIHTKIIQGYFILSITKTEEKPKVTKLENLFQIIVK